MPRCRRRAQAAACACCMYRQQGDGIPATCMRQDASCLRIVQPAGNMPQQSEARTQLCRLQVHLTDEGRLFRVWQEHVSEFRSVNLECPNERKNATTQQRSAPGVHGRCCPANSGDGAHPRRNAGGLQAIYASCTALGLTHTGGVSVVSADLLT